MAPWTNTLPHISGIVGKRLGLFRNKVENGKNNPCSLSLQRPLAVGVYLQHALGLVLSPGGQPHFFDETQVENLGVMPQFGLIKIGMQKVTGESRAVTAHVHPFSAVQG